MRKEERARNHVEAPMAAICDNVPKEGGAGLRAVLCHHSQLFDVLKASKCCGYVNGEIARDDPQQIELSPSS